MTILEWQANQIEGAAKWLAHSIAMTQEDRLTWCASTEESSKTRSALEMADECIGLNRLAASLLRGEAPSAPSGEGHSSGKLSPQEAQKQILESAQELASVVRSLDESALSRSYQTPMGNWPGSFMISVPVANMSYHTGQVNYIQLLYGDTDPHFPSDMGG